MITSLSLTNFKSAKNLCIELKPLTLLAGLNGSGKSSVLQSIGLAKQSLDSDSTGGQLILDGPVVCIGYGSDVLFEAAESDDLAIELASGSEVFQWRGEVATDSDTIPTTFEGDTSKLVNLLKGFQFIQANRIVPDNQYKVANTKARYDGYLGTHGEYTVDFLSRNDGLKVSAARQCPISEASNRIDIDLLHDVAQTDYLPDVISGWLQFLSPGVRAIAKPVELSLSASLRFEYRGYPDIFRALEGREHRPSNVGFGLTYSLPILVACLAAQSGSIILLENPEAHLHPRGQSALGLMLALCAKDGVQIIVETHSDHLLNGIRLAAKKGHINADDVITHFFTRDVATGVSNVTTPILLNTGRYSDWPSGFFDEWSYALDELLDISPQSQSN